MEIEKNLNKVYKNNKFKKNVLNRENEKLKCDDCDFTTTSKKGLKTHVKRKHTAKFPVHCHSCFARK